MRQFRMIRKKAGDRAPEQLAPESQTYKDLVTAIPQIHRAIDFVRANDNVELIGLRMGDTFYSIVVVERTGLQEGHVAL